MDLLSNDMDIMTLSEVAKYLKVAEKTVSRMVHRGEIPCMKIASQWRFLRSVLEDWLLSKMQVVPKNDISRIIESDSSILPVSRLTNEDLILPDIENGSVEAILTQLTDPLAAKNIIQDKDVFLSLLLHRENMASTAVGKGVAIPHVRNPENVSASSPLLIIGRCNEGADFHSPDEMPVYLFFLLYTDSVAVHLRTISKITRVAGTAGFLDAVLEADSPGQIMNLLIRYETQI